MHESKPPSDALVFFGATGDLAYKKIFPALQSLTRRGRLNVPVIGVAFSGWNRDQLIARAKASCNEYGGLDQAAFEKLSANLRKMVCSKYCAVMSGVPAAPQPR